MEHLTPAGAEARVPDPRFGSSAGYCDYILQKQLKDLNPVSVVDFGAGGGKNGELVRKVLQGTRLLAIEGFAPAADALRTGSVYDEVHCALLQDWLERGEERYDVALFGDVLEHLRPPEIHAALRKCLERFNHVVVVVPLHDIFQEEIYGNSLEKHRSYITRGFFRRYRPREQHIVQGPMYTIMNVRIQSGRPRESLKGRIARRTFHLTMIILQPFGMALPLVDLLKRALGSRVSSLRCE